MANTASTPNSDNGPSSLTTKSATAFAYIASVGVGAKVAVKNIKAGCYRQFRDLFPEVVELNKKRKETQEEFTRIYANEPGKTASEIATLNKTYIKDCADAFKKRNLKNTRDYWVSLSDINKLNVMEKAFAFSAITLAATLTVINSKSVNRFLTRRDEKSQSQEHNR